MHRRRIGAAGEQQALSHLEGCGLALVDRNFHSRFGELDLIMLDQSCLVFVEVRMRSSGARIGAAASVTPTKQQRLIKAARYYLRRHAQHAHRRMRFDVVAIDDGQLQWFKAAFDVRA